MFGTLEAVPAVTVISAQVFVTQIKTEPQSLTEAIDAPVELLDVLWRVKASAELNAKSLAIFILVNKIYKKLSRIGWPILGQPFLIMKSF